VFPNEKRELLAGSTEDRRAGQPDAQKGSPAEKGGPEGCRFLQPAPPFSAGPPFCAFCLLCCPPKVHVFHLETQPSN